jgi:hypothetical protein
MKHQSILLLSVLVLVVRLEALPVNNFGGGFRAQNGQNLLMEDWFRDAKRWAKGAELPGPWKAASSDGTKMQMENPGAVFGAEAATATVIKNAAGEIQSVHVEFIPTKAGSSKTALTGRLQAAIGVFQGNAKWVKLTGGSMVNTGHELIVSLQQDRATGNVTARLTRAVN